MTPAAVDAAERSGAAETAPAGGIRAKSCEACRQVEFSFGPTMVYLILAVLCLIILGGGTHVAYRRSKGSSSDHT